MTVLHQSYGYTFGSEVVLPLPLVADDEPAFTIRMGRRDDAEIPSYRLGSVAELAVDEEQLTVWVHPLRELDPPVIDHLLVNLAVPLAITAWLAPVLHASAVAFGDAALLFMGPSGAGKSTMAIACALAGARLIADDGVLCDAGRRRVRGDPDSVRLHPGHAGALLGFDPVGPVVTPNGKRGHSLRTLGVEPDDRWFAVRGLLAIDQPGPAGSRPRLDPCGAAESVSILAQGLFSPPAARRVALDRLDQARVLASWLPVSRLRYPRDLASMAELLEMLRSHAPA